jgi:tetratricopeptide (TPR) repeat protein
MLLAAGKAAEAVPIYRRVCELGPKGGMFGHSAKNAFDLASALKEAGNSKEAERVASETQATMLKDFGTTKPDAQNNILLGKLSAISGKAGEGRAYLNKELEAGGEDPNTLLDLAGLYAVLGQEKPAIATLKKSLERGFSDPFFPVILPEFFSIRKNPEFRALFKLAN